MSMLLRRWPPSRMHDAHEADVPVHTCLRLSAAHSGVHTYKLQPVLTFHNSGHIDPA